MTPPRPTRRWAIYEEEPAQLSVDVLLPASVDEPRLWRVEARRSGRRHDVAHVGLREPLGDDGEPADTDIDLLTQWLGSEVARWRRPFVGSNRLQLRRVDDGVAYDPSGTPVDAPSDLVASHDAVGEDGPATIDVYLPAGRYERRTFRVVARRHGAVLDVVERPLGHPINFGLDVEDAAAIDEAVGRLIDALRLQLPEAPQSG